MADAATGDTSLRIGTDGLQVRIEVDYVDQSGHRLVTDIDFSYLELLKHMAVAGQAYSPSIRKHVRLVGMYFLYCEYLDPEVLRSYRLSEPPPERSDPTEKGQVSNVVGRAFADMLAKRLSGARVTVTYEAAMTAAGHRRQGRRPDLYCIGGTEQFAVEAKGLSQGLVSQDEMDEHKDQSRQGPLPVHFSVACASYNLYRAFRAKYHDPVSPTRPFNATVNFRLLQSYYQGWLEYAASTRASVQTQTFGSEQKLLVELIGPNTPFLTTIGGQSLVLTIDQRLEELVSRGTVYDFMEYLQARNAFDEGTRFEDVDGIGLLWRSAENRHLPMHVREGDWDAVQDENTVVKTVTAWLASKGAVIISTCTTSQHGEDIVAEVGQRILTIEAKGATSSMPGSVRAGQPFTASQVESRLSKAVLRALELSSRPNRGLVGIALPTTPLFVKRLEAAYEALASAGIMIFWVGPGDEVIVENDVHHLFT